MPIDIGEIVGTTPGSVLRRRPNRRSRDESVDDFLGDELIDRATKHARLQFMMSDEARQVEAAERTKNKSFTEESEKLLKTIRQYAAQQNLSPEETRKFALDYLGPRADTPVGQFIIHEAPEALLRYGTSLSEMTDLFVGSLPLGGPREYALAKKSGLLPPDRDIPTMTTKELQAAFDELKSEVGEYQGWWATGADPGEKPTVVHRILGKTVEELPFNEITDQQIYVAAQLNRRRLFEESSVEKSLGVAEAAFLDALTEQTEFDRQTKAQNLQPASIEQAREALRQAGNDLEAAEKILNKKGLTGKVEAQGK